MPIWGYVIIAVAVALAIVAAAAWLMGTRRRSDRLRSRFSSEYDRAVAESGSRKDAERDLAAREQRRERLHIVPLTSAARERYARRWRDTQSEFVDSPQNALRNASALLDEVMNERGYPVHDFEQQAADVSVDHPDVVEHYRAAHEISTAAEDGGGASTEDLRRAMRHYRMLFEDLLDGHGDGDAAADGERSLERERTAS